MTLLWILMRPNVSLFFIIIIIIIGIIIIVISNNLFWRVSFVVFFNLELFRSDFVLQTTVNWAQITWYDLHSPDHIRLQQTIDLKSCN